MMRTSPCSVSSNTLSGIQYQVRGHILTKALYWILLCNKFYKPETTGGVGQKNHAPGMSWFGTGRGCQPRNRDFSTNVQKLKNGKKFGKFTLISKMPHLGENPDFFLSMF